MSKVLFILGAIGSIIYAIFFAWCLGRALLSLPYTISQRVWTIYIFLFSLGILGIYIKRKSTLPIISALSFYAIIILHLLGRVGDPFLYARIIDFLWLIASFFTGATFWVFRDSLIAKPAAIVFMIWGFARFGVKYLRYTTADTLWLWLWLAGTAYVFMVGFAYFIVAARKLSIETDEKREKMKKARQYSVISVFLVVLIILFGPIIAGYQGGYSYRVPTQTGDGWLTASLGDMGIDETSMIKLMNELSHQNVNNVHSIIIIRNSVLVFEEYFSGDDLDLSGNQLNFVHKDFDHNTLHIQASASKSITSILLGIAIDQGLVQGVQEEMFSYFPEYSDQNDTEKSKITLEHLLSMSSGTPWDESYPFTDPRNDLNKMFYSIDPVSFVLEKSVVASPGTQFIYNSGTTNLLGEIVRRSSGLTLKDFAEKYLFAPLGITSFNWVGFPNAPHIALASSTLYLRPRDMAKIGQLYLQKGVWNGTRIISQNWVAESTSEAIQVPPSENPIPGLVTGYGYQWWRGTFSNGNIETYFAGGWGGQFIFVLPDLDMVITFTGGHYGGDYLGFYNLINNYILIAALE